MDLVSYRLQNQRLSRNKFDNAADVVSYLAAVQSQDFAGGKWAIGLRTNGLSEVDVDRAFAEGSILRTHVMRPTWHFVTPQDIRWMLALTAPRVRAQIAFMDRQLELDNDIFKESNDVLFKSLQGGKHLTRAELEPAYQKARIPAKGQRLGHLLMHAELDGIVCSGPRKGKQFTYALLEERVPRAKSPSHEESLAALVTRYFLTRGPATLQDFAWWSGLTVSDGRRGLDMVKSQFVGELIDGQTYWFSDTMPTMNSNIEDAYLLPNYDEFVVGFKDRSAIGKAARQAGIEQSDQALLSNVILLDGQIIGGWRRTLTKSSVLVEASLFVRLTKKKEKQIELAAGRLGAFLGLPVEYTQKESQEGQRTLRSF
jgi:hypothetical protein